MIGWWLVLLFPFVYFVINTNRRKQFESCPKTLDRVAGFFGFMVGVPEPSVDMGM